MEFTIRADAPRIPHKKHWQFCVGSGHALLALRTDYTRNGAAQWSRRPGPLPGTTTYTDS